MANDFGEEHRLNIERMIGATEQQVRATILQVSRNIIMRTPVGDPSLWQSPAPPGYVGGSLRGAWVASIGRPEYVTRLRSDESGARTVAGASNEINALEMGQDFYLTNALPYAKRVEFGSWSRQAPQGMLRRSVIDANQQIDRRYA